MAEPSLRHLREKAILLSLRAAFALGLLSGCGHHVQRAGVVAAPAPVEAPVLLDAEPAAKEYVVDTERSRFEIYGADIFGNEHKMWFGVWRARVRTEPVPAITAEIDMLSVEIDLPRGKQAVKLHLLEADRYPTSTLQATMRRTGKKEGEHVVEGVTELHGVRRGLRFTGLLSPEGENFRFTAEFVISRKDFKLHYRPIEAFLKDDVRIMIDAVAVPVPSTAL